MEKVLMNVLGINMSLSTW